MLTSLCLSASIHSQMRLTTHTYTHTRHTQKHTHLPLPSSPTVMVTVCYGKELPAVVVLLYTLLTLCSLLCFLLYLFPPLICSISLCHDESGRSSDRHRAVTRLLPEISVSLLPSVLCPPCLPALSSFSLSATAALNPLAQTPGVGLKEMWGKGK